MSRYRDLASRIPKSQSKPRESTRNASHRLTHFHRGSFGGIHVSELLAEWLEQVNPNRVERHLITRFIPGTEGQPEWRESGSLRRATRPRPNHAMSTFTTHQALSLPLRCPRRRIARDAGG
ncbi:hypothetical protein ALC53_00367 [Atta colombica]|uniref:Uncharacterized protein n=1 Tax=Atta colombica TaxID=520822 RepID=A0A195BW19_9HYME|nr:hypothetical protein ALC53_00367 [Atta colombica]